MEYFSNNASYQGEYLEGMKNGFGKYVYSNGYIFEGYFLNDMR